MLEPTSAELDTAAREVILTWSDGETTRHDFSDMRRLCPCASCKVEREKVKASRGMSLRVIGGPGTPSLAPVIRRVEPIGRYALRFIWDDGHSAGLFTYEFLREHRKSGS